MFWKKKKPESPRNADFNNYNKQYTEPFGKKENDGENNIILTENIFLSLNSHQTLRNANVLVVGSAGKGKSRHFVKPNILQANCNMVINDPYGDVLKSTEKFLKNEGYQIQVLNLKELDKSDKYNPFDYIHTEEGVVLFIQEFITNTNQIASTDGDIFREKSETVLLQALMFYLTKYRPKEEHNFVQVLELLKKADWEGLQDGEQNELDLIFEEVAKKDPESVALKCYNIFKRVSGKYWKTTIMSLASRLTIFNLPAVQEVTNTTTIDLTSMREGKKALFIIAPPMDTSYNFLVVSLISQLLRILQNEEDTRQKRHVRFIVDEFTNIGYIHDMGKALAIAKNYNTSLSLISQNIAQIKSMYKDDWEAIVWNCDSFLFMGGVEYHTLEFVSKELGPATITVVSNSEYKRKHVSYNQRYTPNPCMTPEDIMRIDPKICILIIRGIKPFKDTKFEYANHKNYKYTADADII